MNETVVDTSVWVDFLRGEDMPLLESALAMGAVVVPGIVCAELLSGARSLRERVAILDLLKVLPLHPTPLEFWTSVGDLRLRLRRLGLSVSTPDTTVAACALDRGAVLVSRDRIFLEISRHTGLVVQG